jgi:hypothetical protein
MATKKAKPAGLTDTRLFALARKQKEAKLAEAAAKADAAELSGKIIPELTRRGVKALESDTVRINKVAPDETIYDLDAMEEHLSPKMFRTLTKRVPDAEAIKAALDSGTLKAKTLAKFATTQPKSAYIIVTLKGDQ